MASPSPRSRSPLRVGGIALLGLGVVAAFAGLISTTQGGTDSTVAQAPTASAEVVEPTAAAPPASVEVAPPADAGAVSPGATTPFVPDDGTPDATAPSVAAEPAPPVVAAPAPEPPPAAAAVREPLRVYNNSKVKGLAAQAADDLRTAGWTVTEIGGYPGATIPTSTVYYRPGTAEQPAAEELGRTFGLRVQPRFAEIQSATPGVIVIVTREYQSPGKS